jgi:hypothetical protein
MERGMVGSKHHHCVNPFYLKQRESLLARRADISVLIYEMEHNTTLNPAAWQIESLRKSLRVIERQIQERQSLRTWKQYERNITRTH